MTEEKNTNEEITEETPIIEVVNEYPEAAEVLLEEGIACITCHFAMFESIGEGLRAHGFSEENIRTILKEMNKRLKQDKGSE